MTPQPDDDDTTSQALAPPPDVSVTTCAGHLGITAGSERCDDGRSKKPSCCSRDGAAVAALASQNETRDNNQPGHCWLVVDLHNIHRNEFWKRGSIGFQSPDCTRCGSERLTHVGDVQPQVGQHVDQLDVIIYLSSPTAAAAETVSTRSLASFDGDTPKRTSGPFQRHVPCYISSPSHLGALTLYVAASSVCIMLARPASRQRSSDTQKKRFGKRPLAVCRRSSFRNRAASTDGHQRSPPRRAGRVAGTCLTWPT